MQQGSSTPIMKHKPFLVTFALLITSTFILFVFIFLTQNCANSCSTQDYRYYDCQIEDTHYCCSDSSAYGPYSCSFFTDCVQATASCPGYYIGLYVSIALNVIISLCLVVILYQNRKRQIALTQAAYQSVQNEHAYSMQQPAPIYNNYQNAPFQPNNNQLIVNGQNYSSAPNQPN